MRAGCYHGSSAANTSLDSLSHVAKVYFTLFDTMLGLSGSLTHESLASYINNHEDSGLRV